MIHGNCIRHATAARITCAKDAATCPAVSNRDNNLWIGHGIIGASQSFFHVHRYRAGYQQQVRVARAGNEFDAYSLQIVVGIIERLNFKLAPIAGAGIDVTDRECTAQDVPQVFLQCFDRNGTLQRKLVKAPSVSPCGASLKEHQTWSPHPSCPL